MTALRRLAVADIAVLDILAREDADFDIAGRGGPRPPLSPREARDFLADLSVLFWVAEVADQMVGFMYAQVLRKRAGAGREVLFYEIGVRTTWRRKGVGRDLVKALEAWMDAEKIGELWVLADNPEATAFYRACGFWVPQPAPVYLVKGVER